jgi:hypothetical protein
MNAKEILKELYRIYDDMEENHSLMWEEHTLNGGTCGEEYELMAEDHYLEGYQAALYDFGRLLGCVKTKEG